MKIRSQNSKTNIEAQKINNHILYTFKIMIINFQVKKKIDRQRHFQKIFLVANIKVEVIFEILFFKFNNENILFGIKILK